MRSLWSIFIFGLTFSPCFGVAYYCPFFHYYRLHDPYADGIRVHTRDNVTFQTKGSYGAHILLQKDRYNFETDVIEVVIGGWNNSQSVIRTSQRGTSKVTYNGSMLSSSTYRWFWISWSGGCVQVGKGKTLGADMVMNWCGLNHSISGIRFRYGYGSDGYFTFEKAVNGGWSDWSPPYSICPIQCGTGSATRSRSCNNPAPSDGGTSCSGNDTVTGTCTKDVACPKTCAEVYYSATSPPSSGTYTFANADGDSFTVYCLFKSGYGYTFISASINVDPNLAQLFTEKTEVLIRHKRNNTNQYDATVAQISRYSSTHLGVSYQSDTWYHEMHNGLKDPYLYVAGVSNYHDTKGWKVQGTEYTFRNCDVHSNLYVWYYHASQASSSDYIPDAFFTTRFEINIGGCGGYKPSTSFSDVVGVSIGLKFLLSCGTPGTISSGSRTFTGTSPGDTVRYTCSPGYTITSGDATRSCTSDSCTSGSWSGTEPTCGGVTYFCPYIYDYSRNDPYFDGIRVDTRDYITFRTKGSHDAQVLLQKDRNNYKTNVIEVVIGGLDGQSVIRTSQQGTNRVTYSESILSWSTYRWFWITWSGGCVQVGTGNTLGWDRIMYWCGLSHSISGVRFSYGSGFDGYFTFEEAVNGGWSSWSAYSSCAVQCGTGFRTRSRSCNNPAPSAGGANCSGSDTEIKTCTKAACPSVTYYCPNSYNYSLHDPYADGIRVDTRDYITFRTNGSHDAHVLLQKDRNNYETNVIEVVIGGWGNSQSVIRTSQQGINRVTYRESILSSTTYRWFWITWSGGCVQVGKGNTLGSNRVMNWCGLSHSISGVRFSYGFGSDGYFKVEEAVNGEWSSWSAYSSCKVQCGTGFRTRSRSCNNPAPSAGGAKCSGSDTETETCTKAACPSVTYYCPDKFDFSRHDPYTDGIRVDKRDYITFQTKGRQDAHVLLQKNRNDYDTNVIEVVIGGWSNSQSVIRTSQQGTNRVTYRESILSSSTYRWFWITWSGGCVQVGKGKTLGSDRIMNWCGLSHSISGVRFSYGYGSDGYFRFEEADMIGVTYYYPDKLDYSLHDPYADGIKVDTRDYITFQTKGRHDAHVLLQKDRNNYETNIIEVAIGGWSNRAYVINEMQSRSGRITYRESILSSSTYRWFWITWSDGCVQVGRGNTLGSNRVMNWCGLSLSISGVRFSYGFGSDGYFKFVEAGMLDVN